MSKIIIIAAVARNGVIGNKGKLPWHVPEDLAHFKAQTMGSPVIMGRKTWETLPICGLPDRIPVVVTRNAGLVINGGVRKGSLVAALSGCREFDKVFVIGGATIYRQAMPFADLLLITRIQAYPEGDTYFPEIPPEFVETECGPEMVSKTGMGFKYVTYERKK